MNEDERHCSNCGYCWHSGFNGCVCMNGWGDNGCDVKSNDHCEDWIPDNVEKQP